MNKRDLEYYQEMERVLVENKDKIPFDLRDGILAMLKGDYKKGMEHFANYAIRVQFVKGIDMKEVQADLAKYILNFTIL